MVLSTGINLPKSHIARFPDRCVVCGCDNPESHLRIITGTIGWWTWLLWRFGNALIVKAPSCEGCAWKLHGLRLLSLLTTIGILAFVFFIIWPQIDDSIPRTLRKWVMMGIALICLVPQFIFEAFWHRHLT